MKTVMQQLKEKIQTVIGEMDGELNSYQSGYKQCLINIQNDIDLQMLAIEKEQMWNYIKTNYVSGEFSLAFHKSEFEQYYQQTYKEDKQ